MTASSVTVGSSVRTTGVSAMQLHPTAPAERRRLVCAFEVGFLGGGLAGDHANPSRASAWRAAGSRFAGSPQPPPPPDRTWITLPDGTGTLTSLLLSFRGAEPGASSV